MNRKEACEEIVKRHPEERFGPAHAVMDDLNVEDHYLLSHATRIYADFAIASANNDVDTAAKLIRSLGFVLMLSDLPMPEGWEEEPEYVEHPLHVECGRLGCQYLAGIIRLQGGGKETESN